MKEKNGRRSFLKTALSLSAGTAASILSVTQPHRYKIIDLSQTIAEAAESTGGKVKKIAVEEHFYPEEYSKLLYAKTGWKGHPMGDSATKVLEYGKGRIKEMDECGIDMQIISLSYPGLDPFKAEDAVSVSKMVNDIISETTRKYPTRFSGYCCIPLQKPEAAADELERAITKLGLRAAMVNENTPERWLADSKYEVIFERLNKLQVPLYLHADGPSTEDSGLHVVPEVMRLVNGDLLDKYPNLQFILGHGGESLPFWLNRLDGRWRDPNRPKKFSGYFKEHFFVSTSSQCWPVLLQFLISALGSDRILFATDYPYESNKQAVDFIDSAPISDSDREKICHLNAEKLFKL